MMVDDVNKTVDFYMDILCCFDLVASNPGKGKFEWALVTCEDNDIMFQSRDSLTGSIPEFSNMETGGTMVIYIETENAVEIYNRIKNKVEVIKGIYKTDYGAVEFIVRDCNGYILVFAELN